MYLSLSKLLIGCFKKEYALYVKILALIITNWNFEFYNNFILLNLLNATQRNFTIDNGLANYLTNILTT